MHWPHALSWGNCESEHVHALLLKIVTLERTPRNLAPLLLSARTTMWSVNQNYVAKMTLQK